MTLPERHARWARAFVDGAVVGEAKSTCDACVLVDRPGYHPAIRGGPFDPVTRCCTFVPVLANFLVGAALRRSGDGRATVERRIDAGVDVTPLALLHDPAWERPYAFGRDRARRCPHHLDDGRCGVWHDRAAACSTWFCRHDRGRFGLAAWKALREVLESIERALARDAALALGIEAHALDVLVRRGAPPGLLSVNGTATVDPEVHRAVWGAWAGRERAFYAACAERVDGLSTDEVLRIGGDDVATAIARYAEAQKALSEPIPAALTGAGALVVEAGRVDAYSAWDPVDVPADVAARLAPGVPFDASGVDPRLVRALVDAGALE